MQVGCACSKLKRVCYGLMNAINPHTKVRWSFTASLALAYAVTSPNICSDIITYLISFYLLTMAINYFTPKGVAQEIGMPGQDEQIYSLQDAVSSSLNHSTFAPINGLNCDHSADKPLARSLCEQAIWARTTIAFALGALCSYFKMLQIDVFWPLLLLYFAGLALYTISKILRTMDRYRYSLADFQKGSTQTFRP